MPAKYNSVFGWVTSDAEAGYGRLFRSLPRASTNEDGRRLLRFRFRTFSTGIYSVANEDLPHVGVPLPDRAIDAWHSREFSGIYAWSGPFPFLDPEDRDFTGLQELVNVSGSISSPVVEATTREITYEDYLSGAPDAFPGYLGALWTTSTGLVDLSQDFEGDGYLDTGAIPNICYAGPYTSSFSKLDVLFEESYGGNGCGFPAACGAVWPVVDGVNAYGAPAGEACEAPGVYWSIHRTGFDNIGQDNSLYYRLQGTRTSTVPVIPGFLVGVDDLVYAGEVFSPLSSDSLPNPYPEVFSGLIYGEGYVTANGTFIELLPNDNGSADLGDRYVFDEDGVAQLADDQEDDTALYFDTETQTYRSVAEAVYYQLQKVGGDYGTFVPGYAAEEGAQCQGFSAHIDHSAAFDIWYPDDPLENGTGFSHKPFSSNDFPCEFKPQQGVPCDLTGFIYPMYDPPPGDTLNEDVENVDWTIPAPGEYPISDSLSLTAFYHGYASGGVVDLPFTPFDLVPGVYMFDVTFSDPVSGRFIRRECDGEFLGDDDGFRYSVGGGVSCRVALLLRSKSDPSRVVEVLLDSVDTTYRDYDHIIFLDSDGDEIISDSDFCATVAGVEYLGPDHGFGGGLDQERRSSGVFAESTRKSDMEGEGEAELDEVVPDPEAFAVRLIAEPIGTPHPCVLTWNDDVDYSVPGHGWIAWHTATSGCYQGLPDYGFTGLPVPDSAPLVEVGFSGADQFDTGGLIDAFYGSDPVPFYIDKFPRCRNVLMGKMEYDGGNVGFSANVKIYRGN